MYAYIHMHKLPPAPSSVSYQIVSQSGREILQFRQFCKKQLQGHQQMKGKFCYLYHTNLHVDLSNWPPSSSDPQLTLEAAIEQHNADTLSADVLMHFVLLYNEDTYLKTHLLHFVLALMRKNIWGLAFWGNQHSMVVGHEENF